MASIFSIQFSHDIQEISVNGETEGEVLNDSIRYFYFYNNNPTFNMDIEVRTINSGTIRFFLARGKNSRPDASKNLKQAWSNQYGGKL
jgi:hypothetical protein